MNGLKNIRGRAEKNKSQSHHWRQAHEGTRVALTFSTAPKPKKRKTTITKKNNSCQQNAYSLLKMIRKIRNSFTTIVNSSTNFQVINAYGTREDAIKHIAADRPDYVLMDIELLGMNGIKGTKIIKRQTPARRNCDGDRLRRQRPYGVEALKAGASGYITNQPITWVAARLMKSRGAHLWAANCSLGYRQLSSIPNSPLTKREPKSPIDIEGKRIHKFRRSCSSQKRHQNTYQNILRQTAGKLQSEAMAKLPWKN